MELLITSMKLNYFSGKLLCLLLAVSGITAAQSTSCNFNESNSLKAYLKPSKHTVPLIMAHQGGTENGLPGNSMATFKKTYEKVGCVLLEFDIRMTADSLLVISHDNELELRTNGSGLLNQQSWEKVKNLRLKDSNGKITKYPIPTFQEVLQWSHDKSLILIVDKKPETDLAKTISLLRKTNNLNKSVLICYSLTEAQTAHKLAPELMLAVGFNSPAHIAAIEKSGIPLENLLALTPRDLQEKTFYQKIHDMNIISSLGTNGNVDTLQITASKPLYQKISKSGPDIICTDNPILVQSIFKEF